MNRRFRILFLSWRDVHHPEAGGAEKYLSEVAEGLVARGHQVTIRTAAYPGAIPDEVVHGVAYSRRGGRFGVFPRALASRLTGRLRADVVVDVQNGVPFLSPLGGRARVINLVHHVHKEQWPVVVGERAAGVGWWLESQVAPRVYRRSEYVAVSQATRAELAGLGVDPSRTEVIHNGTDVVADPHVTRSPEPVVTVLGRLVPHKRVEIALDAVAALANDFPGLRLNVVGSGWWGPRLESYAAELGIADRVTFTGHVSEGEKHRILAESWVLAFPSLKEGWGLVVVEAGVHGTPSVAFRQAGGLRESIHDQETGLLSDEGAEAFTACLRRLLADPQLRHRMGVAAQAWVTRFRWSETVDAWERLLVGPEAADPRADATADIAPPIAAAIIPVGAASNQAVADWMRPDIDPGEAVGAPSGRPAAAAPVRPSTHARSPRRATRRAGQPVAGHDQTPPGHGGEEARIGAGGTREGYRSS